MKQDLNSIGIRNKAGRRWLVQAADWYEEGYGGALKNTAWVINELFQAE